MWIDMLYTSLLAEDIARRGADGEFFGHSIFCDDILSVDGGKLSFFGCYNGVMFVDSTFPLTLERFCIHFQIYMNASCFYDSVVVRCYTPGKDAPVAEQTIETPTRNAQKAMLDGLAKEHNEPRYIVAASSLIFSPLTICRPGLVRVRAIVNDEPRELKLGSMRVEMLAP